MKNAITDIVNKRTPFVLERMSEMNPKDEVNALIQLMKFVVPTLKSVEAKVDTVPHNKVDPFCPEVLQDLLDGLNSRNKDKYNKSK